MSCAWIVGAGDFSPTRFQPKSGDVVIAVDGGLRYLEQIGVKPDLAVGDFDSLGYVPQGVKVVRHSPIKDQTDMFLAAQEAIASGCDELMLLGATGGRLAHTLANLQLLSFLEEQGISAFLTDDNLTATALQSGTLTFDEASRGYLSVFAHGANATGVYLTGLKYPLVDAALTPDFPLGVSNEFIGVPASVTVQKGTVLVLWDSRNSKPKREKKQ
ncbi:MAG TPA: thiamine diphosphokinase [Ruminococcaceae bacterium]|nr:thiamine diphosphokinase [Oscillospiraceae bacterium]